MPPPIDPVTVSQSAVGGHLAGQVLQ